MHSFFAPHSPQGRAVVTLWWAMFGAGAVVWVVVLALMIVAVIRRRPRAEDEAGDGQPRRARSVVLVGVAITVATLAAFLLFDFAVDRMLVRRAPAALTIDITGHQWWWEVEYEDSIPDRRLVTANEIHVPVGQLVLFKLHAADVIHSFWAPSLNGKRDLIPGYETSAWFQVDTPGVYRGQCAEFCGLEHARMAFVVVAESLAAFAAWRARNSTPSRAPTDVLAMEGQRVFLTRGCALCHSIDGTAARGTIGPSLSHVASRSTLAAGTLPNTRGHLSGWIANPTALKPGTRMPRSLLMSDELRAVVAYLETLR